MEGVKSNDVFYEVVRFHVLELAFSENLDVYSARSDEFAIFLAILMPEWFSCFIPLCERTHCRSVRSWISETSYQGRCV